MKYQNIAQRLAAEGRGPDTTLVHMSKDEVKSLQDIAMAHGGSLTVNPNTGLPEAGFLSNILPIVGGAAMTAMGVPPPIAAMIMGGGTALATGDINKGLAAGLGAYGGAGLGAGLAGAGAGTAEAAAGALGVEGAATGAGSQASMLAAQNQGFGQAGLEALGQSAGYASGASPVVPSAFSSMATGLQNLGTEAGRAGFMGEMGGLSGLGKYGLAALSPILMAQNQKAPGTTSTPTMNRLEYQPNVTNPFPKPDVPGYGDLGRDFGREQQYYSGRYVDTGRKFVPGDFLTPKMADGGMSSAIGNNVTYPLSGVSTAQIKSGIQDPQQANVLRNTPVSEVDPYTGEPRFAGGGISHLGDYSDGGRMLRGPGDGVSDSIPATIGGKQPARLADGEFVVPARIVSELGNGSSEAGARKLYAMLDRVQNARKKSVGKDKVAVDSKAEKMLPA